MLPSAPEKIYTGTDAMEAERLFAQISRAPSGNERRTGRCQLNESRRWLRWKSSPDQYFRNRITGHWRNVLCGHFQSASVFSRILISQHVPSSRVGSFKKFERVLAKILKIWNKRNRSHHILNRLFWWSEVVKLETSHRSCWRLLSVGTWVTNLTIF